MENKIPTVTVLEYAHECIAEYLELLRGKNEATLEDYECLLELIESTIDRERGNDLPR